MNTIDTQIQIKKRLSFVPTDEQLKRYENLPRHVNLSDELRELFDHILEKYNV